MNLPQVVSEAEWQAAQEALRAEEKEATRARDALAAERRRLPMVRIDKDYIFDGPAGKAKLLDLFEERKQLLLYHFMFGPNQEAGCDGCSMFVDQIGHLAHLHARDTSFALEDGVVYHTYSCYDRGTDVLNATWQLLDRSPEGRGDDPEAWPRRHDEYE